MEKRKILKTGLWIAGGLAGAWVFLRLLLPLLLPFILAFALAAATEPAVGYLMKKTSLSRPWAGGLCTLGAYLALLFLLCLLGRTLLRELGSFLRELPVTIRRLEAPAARLQTALTRLTRELPPDFSGTVDGMVADFLRGGAGLAGKLPGQMLSLATKAAGKLPGFFLSLVTTVLASFMASASLPRLRSWLSRVLPQPWRGKITVLWHRCRRAVGGWLLAEAKLGGVTFLVATLGLMLLRVPYPLLFGLLVALVDLMPVLGSGTVLIPWALLHFLRGETTAGVCMLLLYAAAAVIRAVLEPRFLGKQMGLPPLMTLAAVYIGCRVAGLWGLLLAPILVSVVFQIRGRTKNAPA